MIAHRSSTYAQGGGGTSSLNPGEPAGAQENDVIIGLATFNTGTGVFTIPADMATIDDLVQGSVHHTIMWKRRGTTAGLGYTVSHDTTTAQMGVSFHAFSGVHLTNAFDVSYLRASHYVEGNNNLLTLQAAGITTVTNEAMILLLEWITSTIDGEGGPPSGYTEFSDNLAGGNNRGHYLCGKIRSTAGAETPGAFTHSDTIGNADPRIVTLALRPAPTAGTVTSRTLTDGLSVRDNSAPTSQAVRAGDRVETVEDQIFLYGVLGRLIQDNFPVQDQIRLTKSVRKLMQDSVSLADANEVLRESFRVLSDMIAPADFVHKTITRNTFAEVFVTLTEEAIPVVDFVDAQFFGIRQRVLADGLSVSDVMYREVARKLSNQFPVFDGSEASRQNRRTLSDVLRATDSASGRRARRRVVQELTAIADSLVSGREAAPKTYVLTLTDELGVTDSAIGQHVRPPVPGLILFGIEEQ